MQSQSTHMIDIRNGRRFDSFGITRRPSSMSRQQLITDTRIQGWLTLRKLTRRRKPQNILKIVSDSHQDARRTQRVDDSRRIFSRNKAKNGGVPEDRGCAFPSTNNPSHIGAHVDERGKKSHDARLAASCVRQVRGTCRRSFVDKTRICICLPSV